MQTNKNLGSCPTYNILLSFRRDFKRNEGTQFIRELTTPLTVLINYEQGEMQKAHAYMLCC